MLLLGLSFASCLTCVLFLNSICSILGHCLYFMMFLLVSLLLFGLSYTSLLVFYLCISLQFTLWYSFTLFVLVSLLLLDLFYAYLLVFHLYITLQFNLWYFLLLFDLCGVFCGLCVAWWFALCACSSICVIFMMRQSPIDVPFPQTFCTQLLIYL